jgi:streptogramin lyase
MKRFIAITVGVVVALVVSGIVAAAISASNAMSSDSSPGAVMHFYGDANISTPWGITVGSDGALWFANESNNTIGRITKSGAVTSYAAPGIDFPQEITAGPDGALWFTNWLAIGRITTSGAITIFSDPSISFPGGIVVGPDGALWFTNGGNNTIGRISTDGLVKSFSDPTISSPDAIALGPDGALWFTNQFADPYTDTIGRITTSGAVTSYSGLGILRPRGIAAGPDGALWFTNLGNGTIGRISTDGTVTNYWNAGIYHPVGIVAGPDGALWFSQENGVGRITTSGTFSFYLDSNVWVGNTIVASSDGDLWFTSEKNNLIGQVTLLPPSPSAPDLISACDSGAFNWDNVTRETSLTFVGTAEPGMTVTLFRGEGVAGTATADAATGAWSIDDTVTADGAYGYTATALDATGKVSAPSLMVTVTVDTSAPTAPSRPDLKDDSDTGVSAMDNITSRTSLALAGTAEIGSTVTLHRGATTVGTATADPGSSVWSITDGVPGDGTFSYKATATDAAGNASPTSDALVVTVDTVPPSLNVTGAASGTVYAMPALPVRPASAPVDNGSGIASQHDNWTTPVGGPAGLYTYTATATDTAGNQSTEIRTYTAADLTPPPAPPAPDLLPESDSGVSSSDNVTNNTTLIFSGLAEPRSTVTLYRSGANEGTTTAANGSGAWSLTDHVSTDGTYVYTVTATDPAGNTSPASKALGVTVDTHAPELNVTGAANGSEYTLPALPTRPTFSPADPGGSGITNQQDNWTTPGTSNGAGTYVYAATAADKAGNSSSETRTYTVIAPASTASSVPAPSVTATITAPASGGGGGGGGATVTITISPKSQTIASGGTATFTITATNTGGGYLYGGKVSDGAALNCSHALETSAEPGLLPPNGGSLTYTCSVSGVTASFTNTVTASGLTQNGDKVTTSDSADVTVTGSAPPATPATTAQPPTKTLSVVRPVIGKASAVPARPRAGKAVLVSFKVTHSNTRVKLTSGKMICDPRIGTHLLRHAEQFKNGTASLHLTIPENAKGKLLKVHLTIRLGAQSATRIATFQIS